MFSVSASERQQVLQALERLQSKLVQREEWTHSDRLGTLKEALQSPLFGHILTLQHSVKHMHGRDELDSAARQISGCRFHGAAAETAAGFSAPRILSRSSWVGCSSAAAAAEPVAGGKVEGCDAGLDAAAVAATAVDALAIRSCTNNDLVGNSQFWQPLQHSAADLGRVWNSL